MDVSEAAVLCLSFSEMAAGSLKMKGFNDAALEYNVAQADDQPRVGRFYAVSFHVEQFRWDQLLLSHGQRP